MKILVTGATGLIGEALVLKLLENGDEVIAVGRSKEKIKKVFGEMVKAVSWNIYEKESLVNDELKNIIGDVDSIVNLAGENIAGRRWNAEFKKKIYDSRILSTRLLSDLTALSDKKPGSFVAASAVGFYGVKSNHEITEEDGPGTDFMADVCCDWERESENLVGQSINRLVIRTGVVLSAKGGALKKMLLPYKLFVGGPLGSGKQWFPWIHIRDLVEIILSGIKGDLTGTVNAVAPEAITMNEFGKILGQQLGRPSLFKVPKFMLKIIFGKGAEYLVEGNKIKPARLHQAGYSFNYPNVLGALGNLLK